ncbi:Lon protease C-terminal proteolytic domain-containing protein [Pilobolus umbonatus]|nr:Lon protease C-terminal proteolytic domain-containing protein [Pilobolus umbonatus]
MNYLFQQHIKSIYDRFLLPRPLCTLRKTASTSMLNYQQPRYIHSTSFVRRERDPTDNETKNLLQKPVVPEDYPQVLALPIANRPLFPGFYKAVVIKDATVTAAIKELLKKGQPYIGAFLIKDEKLDIDIIESMDQVYPVGVFAQITSVFPISSAINTTSETDPGITAVLYPHRRIKLTTLCQIPKKKTEGRDRTSNIPINPVLALAENFKVSVGNVENLQEPEYTKNSPLIRALTSEIVTVFKDIAQLNPLFRDQITSFTMSQSAANVFEDPSKLADFAAAVSSSESAELQEILSTLPVEERLQKSLETLKKELVNAQLQNKISKEVESKIVKRQREYYLMEQLKGIKKELGMESDGKDKLIEQYREREKRLKLPDYVKEVFEEELNKLAYLEPVASEFNVTRNYLDWITQIPWGQRSRENYNLVHARTILDEDHYGLKDVKDRILEFISVGRLRGTIEGKILCLVGPPGVGKTSIGKSVARALDRQFYRFSVGGLADASEIKGHRRTYVGAMPGKVIQALKKVKAENPLIMIDEIDKMGRGHQGDPSSALLELLDPEQNSNFLDYYLDIPVDLSKVLFMCTANILDTISNPLMDRMEVIQLSGYVEEEKKAIASKYLIPAARMATGLEHVHVNLTDDAIDSIIKNYCRESGVRNLKKQIDKVFRKAAYKVVSTEEKHSTDGSDTPDVLSADKRSNNPTIAENAEKLLPQQETQEGEEIVAEERKPLEIKEPVDIEINAANLKDYIGPAIFHSDRMYEETPPGVVMGLAWTNMGGASLYVESVLESTLSPDASPHLSKTGQLGDVMKESTSIAYTFAKSLVARQFPKNKFFDKAHVHLHCPAGAVPKDGPSAGITMATSLLSLAMDTPVSPDIAMTGELTVTGKILQIGGLKEKVIAAKRSKVKTVLFPKDNQADWDDLEEYIRKDINGIAVDMYSDVFDIVFPHIDKNKVEHLWSKALKKPRNSKKSTMSA